MELPRPYLGLVWGISPGHSTVVLWQCGVIKTSLPFIASGFALRFYLLCDEWWIPKWYWELRRMYRPVFDGEGPSAPHRLGFSPVVFCPIESIVGLYDGLVTR